MVADAWCELRQAIPSFRLDRIRQMELREERFKPQPGQTLADFFKMHHTERGGTRDD